MNLDRVAGFWIVVGVFLAFAIPAAVIVWMDLLDELRKRFTPLPPREEEG